MFFFLLPTKRFVICHLVKDKTSLERLFCQRFRDLDHQLIGTSQFSSEIGLDSPNALGSYCADDIVIGICVSVPRNSTHEILLLVVYQQASDSN